MADNQWGEIFNLTAELKRIEDEVDKRLEETLAEDPHVIEQETVHYGAAAAAADRAEEFRMRQSVPLFGSVGIPTPQNMTPDTAQAPNQGVSADEAGASYMAAAAETGNAADAASDAQRAEAASLEAAAAVWAEPPVDDYAAPRATEPGESIYDPRPVEPAVPLYNERPVQSEVPLYDARPAEPAVPLYDVENVTTQVAVTEQAADAAMSAEEHADESVQASDAASRNSDDTIMASAVRGPVSAFVFSKLAPHTSDADRTAATESMQTMADAIVEHEGSLSAVEDEIENRQETAEDRVEAAPEAVPAEAEITQGQETAAETARSAQPSQQMAAAAGNQAAPESASAETEPKTQTDVKTETVTPGWQQALRGVTADRRKVLGILIVIIVILAIILGGRSYKEHARLESQYQQGETLYESGDYDAAAEAFTAVSSYKDAAERALAAQYAKASAYVDEGAYQDAIDYVGNLSAPTDAMLTLRSHAIYQLALRYYENGDMDAAEGELLMIQDYEEDGTKAIDLLHQIQYQSAADALVVYDYETAEPILAALGDYEDAPILLSQVQNAIDVVYTDVARDDNGKEIKGKTEYLWVHSVITPGAISADLSAEEQTTAYRELAGATGSVDDDAVHVLMMQMGRTDAAMTYEDAEPIETDSSTIITKDVSSYAAIDSTFGTEQTVYSPQRLQRSNTDYALAFDGSGTYAAADRKDDEVVMECKIADDAYWVKTRRVYAQLEDDKFIGVSRHQLRTWTKVLNESLADEVRAGFLSGLN